MKHYNWNTYFLFEYIYLFFDGKAEFLAAITPVSHDPWEIIHMLIWCLRNTS